MSSLAQLIKLISISPSCSYKESVKNFAGCIGDIRYTLNTGLQMMPRSLKDGILRQKNVQLDGCFPSVNLQLLLVNKQNLLSENKCC